MTVSEYEICVQSFSDNLYRFALKSLRDEQLAEDIVQESFLRMWENREAVLVGKEKSYLFTIAYRLIIDQTRRQKRYAPEEGLERKSDESTHLYNGAAEWVHRCIDRLPEIQRNLILLRDYEGYSYQEMAEMTSLSVAQVKVYIFRARTTLKEQLGKLENLV